MKVNTIGDAMFYMGLHGLVGGSILGGLYGALLAFIYGAVFGLFAGAIVGGIAGLIVGLILVLAIRDAKSVHDVEWFCFTIAVISAVFTFIVAILGFSAIWSGGLSVVYQDPLSLFPNAFNGINFQLAGLPAIIAALYAAYEGWKFVNRYM